MRVGAVLNPRAGVAARRALEAFRRRPRWGDVEVRVTAGPGDARRWAEEAARDRMDLLLVAGGDGTANEAAWGLLGSRTTLGLVPVGSGNGLARTLGIPLRPARALECLEGGVLRRMDVGMVNGRPFLNVCGAGFDATVGAEFHARGRRGGRRGLFTYVWLSLGQSLRYRSERWRLEAGDHRFEGRALLVAFVNGRQYGGAATIAPGARLDDGLLDIVVVEDAPLPEILANAPRLFLGGIERFRRYRRLTAARAVLTGAAPALFHRDGEPEPAADRLEVSLEPRALSVLVPRVTADNPDGPFSGAG
ncbi:MAG TPA: diacylglycerol kinase family protein [Vicinamibacteria bacterium]|nr:diacylglycerol kinase family protein [Vicinamibacteria bacterium]